MQFKDIKEEIVFPRLKRFGMTFIDAHSASSIDVDGLPLRRSAQEMLAILKIRMPRLAGLMDMDDHGRAGQYELLHEINRTLHGGIEYNEIRRSRVLTELKKDCLREGRAFRAAAEAALGHETEPHV